jgi:hypothetical protein
MRSSIHALRDETAWGRWYPLEDCWRGTTLPSHPGLYRIRLLDSKHLSQLAYIGQSGNLKERIGALKNVYKAAMPYKAPHTAAPALWAWLHTIPSSRFEISVAPFPAVSDVLRLGLECVALAFSRQQYMRSPLANFGRMPQGYKPSSGNDARLVLSGKRFRGGPTSDILDCHLPGIAPRGTLEGDPHARRWCGHYWTPWIPIQSIRPVEEIGLYRLRVWDLDPLLFLGQGKLADRLKAIRPLEKMECSWVADQAWYAHQRLEFLTDLIGAHLLVTATIPLWQFEPSHAALEEELLRRIS